MSTNTRTAPRTETAERAAAISQTLAPIAAGALAPLLDPSAATIAGGAYLAGAAFVYANFTGHLGRWADDLPAIDIARAHRDTLGISAITTGMALGIGTLGGPEATDALMAGALQPLTIPGILSLGWWAAVALVPLKLRSVFGRKRLAPATAAAVDINQGPGEPVTLADQIIASWGRHISDADKGQHRHQILTDVTVYTDRWTGRIIAPAGASVTVTKESVSSVYRRNPAWIEITHGDHSGEAHITVNHHAPAELDPNTLAGAWKKRLARPGGLMPKTHLEDVTYDPNTEGESAYVCADDDLDLLKAPDRLALAGALRTSPLLVSYEPLANNPRKAILRTMPRNPLERGRPFQGLASLKASAGGRFRIGGAISGHPALVQLYDPKLGAIHLVIAGTTGSGKGGASQMVALGCHENGYAMLYADPKGASNPSIPHMAAYSGLQQYGSLGSLRISYAVLMHRKEEAAKYDLKNFVHSKGRPLTPTILDEAGQVLGPGVPNRKEAVAITKAGASLGRSLGMPWVLINQVVNLDQLGGEQAIRANLIKGGTWLILRTDSDQTNLSDLPPGFEGIDPGMIPAVWSTDDESLVYDEALPENDPVRTFGLGYLAAAGGRPGMMRVDILEDGTPHVQPDRVAAPEDVPWWGDEAAMEEIANTPIPGFEEDGSGDEDQDRPVIAPGVDLPARKEQTAEEKVLAALRDDADPLHLDYLAGNADVDEGDFEINYMDRPALHAATGLVDSTFANTLKKLEAAGKLHRITEGKTVRVGLGRQPAVNQNGEYK
ncbi:type IV secretory system conjugative DNA transfer family protein [Streptomyces chartreusis]|uniref:type IV secretory system conjugative DNA transfer family protein n=1 Tax=Streptomyces chartreusis TaxID=1969 RepID=UPI003710926D